MINLTLRQLRYFEALARHCHFGRAADACANTQPALSMQIKELEESLGGALFERGARQIRLTSFGEEFALRVRDILRSVDEVADMARASQGRLVGRLRIGVIPTIAPYLMPTIIARLTRLYAGLDIQLRETVTPRLIQELAEGRLDAAIVALPVSEPSFAEVALFTESKRPMTATALEPSTVLCIPRPLFLKMLESFPDAARSLRDIMASRVDRAVSEVAAVKAILGIHDE